MKWETDYEFYCAHWVEYELVENENQLVIEKDQLMRFQFGLECYERNVVWLIVQYLFDTTLPKYYPVPVEVNHD